MRENKQDTEAEQVPEIYCALSVIFHKNIDVVAIIREFNKIGIPNISIHYPRHDSSVYLLISIVHYERFWDVESALERLFAPVDHCLCQVKKLVVENNGKINIDISFYQYGIYPALVFCGSTMRKMRYLEADISIDPFDCKEN